jgi:hypothetical protein
VAIFLIPLEVHSGNRLYDISDRALAKPGYGKTVLSTAIIDDLTAKVAELAGDAEAMQQAVAFFHFNSSERTGFKTSTEAFRALAAQLIHFHRREPATMDALAVIFDKFSDGQEHASGDDVDAVLRILLQQCQTYLVIDGVDECTDSSAFLSTLSQIMVEVDCKVLLLSRPGTKSHTHVYYSLL